MYACQHSLLRVDEDAKSEADKETFAPQSRVAAAVFSNFTYALETRITTAITLTRHFISYYHCLNARQGKL
jgi:hypothetical protein